MDKSRQDEPRSERKHLNLRLDHENVRWELVSVSIDLFHPLFSHGPPLTDTTEFAGRWSLPVELAK
jgi:hypothetical protein